MGVAKLFGVDPVEYARGYFKSAEEIERRRIFEKRASLVNGWADMVVREEIDATHTDLELRRRMKRFAHLAVAQAPFARLVAETTRPVYFVPAIRAVEPESQQSRWAAMAAETRLNEKMDAVLCTLAGANHAFLLTRYVARLDRAVSTVIPPHRMAVIPDPDDNSVAIAYMYDRAVMDWRTGATVTHRVFWDDTVTFEYDQDLQVVRGPEAHLMPAIPIMAAHLTYERDGYWDLCSGSSDVAADLQCKIMEIWKLRALKAQAFRQRWAGGPAMNFPKDQVFDPENILIAGEGVTINELAETSSLDMFLKAEESAAASAAAGRGVSRARLNQDKADASSDTGLMESRAAMMKRMFWAEHDQFTIMKMVSQEYPDEGRRIAMETTLDYIDFGEIQHRVDRMTQLAIREKERSMGLRSVIDDLLEDQPELDGDRKRAAKELERNMMDEAAFILRRRALNIPEDATVDEPGQNPGTNGAMGPMVRDGLLTRDEASEMARDGI